MTKFEILFSQTAVSQLSLLDAKLTKRIKQSLRELEENPFQRRSGADIKKLVTPYLPVFVMIMIKDTVPYLLQD